MKNKEITCPKCKSDNLIRSGKRKLKTGPIQVYQCQQCGSYFSDRKMKYKSYQAKIILNALSIYNLGYSLEETRKQIAQRFKKRVPSSTLYSWIDKYQNLCLYLKVRTELKKEYSPEKILFTKEFKHQQNYKFQYHKAKLDLRIKKEKKRKFQAIKEYLKWVAGKEENCPGTKRKNPFPHHIFVEKNKLSKQRASQVQMKKFIPLKKAKNNLANLLAESGLKLASNNYERHEQIQKFMLLNDLVTVATEVPVYLTNDDIKYFKSKGFQFNFNSSHTPITGHIDLLQIRNNLIYILDYKPKARLEKPFEQLTAYALALASRTKLALRDFKCAWFDESNYYEFFPLHVVYPKQIKRNFLKTKENIV